MHFPQTDYRLLAGKPPKGDSLSRRRSALFAEFHNRRTAEVVERVLLRRTHSTASAWLRITSIPQRHLRPDQTQPPQMIRYPEIPEPTTRMNHGERVWPNDAMEPIPVAVTNRAYPCCARARFAPATSMAHLER